MGILSRLFSGSSDEQALPKDERWEVDTTVSSDEVERVALAMGTCSNCQRGYMCAMHAVQFNAIDEYED
jgi:hypothetical protein